MDSKVADVMALLSKMSAPSTETTSSSKASPLAPSPELIEPWEPLFIEGVSKNIDGSNVTLSMIEAAFDAGENIHLVGPSGCGKTTIARAILDRKNAKTRAINKEIWTRNKEILKVRPGTTVEDLEEYQELPFPMSHYSCHSGTRSEELIGSVTLKFDENGNRIPVEVPGAVTRAWEGGETLILEEFDIAPPGVLGELHAFLDGSTKMTTVYINGPRDIHKSPDFRCIATSNTRGAGEGAIEFAGTQPLNGAFMNRFNYTICVSWLPEAEEAKLIRSKTGLSNSSVEKMVRVANKVRAGYEAEQLDRPISTRNLLAWAREVKRGSLRVSGASTLSERDFWKAVVIPAAAPSILNGMADVSSREAVSGFLSML